MQSLMLLITVGGFFGAYETSVLLRLNIALSRSTSVQHYQRCVGISMVMARTTGFEHATA
eukprot:7353442-Heterocapsa_arctica.AAC.1